jgi:Domain of unknown function (DUF4326)
MCEVIHVRDADNGALYIGRPRKGEPLTSRRAIWGNPYVTREQDAGRVIHSCGVEIETVLVPDNATAIAMFRQFLAAQVEAGSVSLVSLAQMQGRKLSCFCAPAPCHGDVLASASAWAAEQVPSADEFVSESKYADVDVPF